MQGVAPFMRKVVASAQQPCSKIPHLNYHIVRRQARLNRSRNDGLPRPVTRRCLQSTLASSAGSIAAEDECEGSKPSRFLASSFFKGHEQDAQSRPDIQNEILLGEEEPPRAADLIMSGEGSAETIERLLKEENPERLLFALVHSSAGIDFIRNADDALFTSTLCTIDPDRLLGPFKDAHRDVTRSLSEDPTYRWVRSLQSRLDSFAHAIDGIVTTRTGSGHRLSLDVYKYLLKCARIMDDGVLARHIVTGMMPEDGILSDLQCYNDYMEALNWTDASGLSRHRLRVLPRLLRMRASNHPPKELSGHRVSSPARKDFGIRHEALEAFQSLISQGLHGDETTFTNLMVAMAREGDVAGVKSILKSVWNIDVDLLAKFDEEEIESPTFYESGTPLRPSERLLFTVAHAFGINNDVAQGAFLIDYISRNYDLTISERVWRELYERSLVLSLQRKGRGSQQRRQEQTTGAISPEFPEHLFRRMTDEPYNLVPDVAMLTLRARSRRDVRLLDEAINSIAQAIAKMESNRVTLNHMYDFLRDIIQSRYGGSALGSALPADDFLVLRREFLLTSLRVDADLQLIIHCIRNIFQENEWAGSGKLTEWSRRTLPTLLARFQEYVPNELKYQIPTGTVVLHGKDDRNEAIRRKHDDLMRKVGMMRAAIDTEDPGKLVRNAEKVIAMLQVASQYCFRCETSTHSTEECPNTKKALPDLYGPPSLIRRTGTDPSMTTERDASQASSNRMKIRGDSALYKSVNLEVEK